MSSLFQQVDNIEELKIGDVHFMVDNDHSKWAVSTDPNGKWICMADINRQVREQSLLTFGKGTNTNG